MGMLAGRRILGLRLQTKDGQHSALDSQLPTHMESPGTRGEPQGRGAATQKDNELPDMGRRRPSLCILSGSQKLTDTQHNFQEYLILIMLQSIRYTSLGYMPRSDVTGSYGRSDFSFWRIHHTGYTSLHPRTVNQGSILCIPASICCPLFPWSGMRQNLTVALHSMPPIVKDGEQFLRYPYTFLFLFLKTLLGCIFSL